MKKPKTTKRKAQKKPKARDSKRVVAKAKRAAEKEPVVKAKAATTKQAPIIKAEVAAKQTPTVKTKGTPATKRKARRVTLVQQVGSQSVETVQMKPRRLAARAGAG